MNKNGKKTKVELGKSKLLVTPRIDEFQFWKYNDKGKLVILQSKLNAFLEYKGLANIKLSDTNYLLVRQLNNKIRLSSDDEAAQIIKNHIDKKQLEDVLEEFSSRIGSYLGTKKFSLLKSIELVNDRDGKDYSRFYFFNNYVHVTKENIDIVNYEYLEGVIWEDRITPHSFNIPNKKKEGQFETFCWNICKKDKERFSAFKTMLGYTLHRNKDRGEDRAIILYDEKMGIGNKANGGTGKTLLYKAIAQCRELVEFSGKQIKIGSWFNKQRINLTTDLLAYDDLDKSVNLEYFFDMITSGIEVEKKRKQAFHIPRDKSPKIILTSNYLVKGPGGSSDIRRRYEFELANHYNEDFIPEDEFGNRFFENDWSDFEWNSFFYFMMSCVQDYLLKGLIQPKPMNLIKNKLESKSCREFIEYADFFVEWNSWQDKREFQKTYYEFFPEAELVTSHMFTKWLKEYALDIGGDYLDKSSGGKFLFTIKKKEIENG